MPGRLTARVRLVIALDGLARWLHRGGRIKPGAAAVKVNLGSGLFVASGWINIDGSLKTLLARCPAFVLHAMHPWLADSGVTREQFITLLQGNRFVHRDLRYGIPLSDSSADFIFSSHMLHHLYRDQAAQLLAEALRILKPGGVVRLVVPDLEYIVRLYQRGQREQALSYFFYPSARRALFTRRYQYDFALLKALLASVGFCEIHRCAYRQGSTPDLDVLDRLPEESLYVEARRPLS